MQSIPSRPPSPQPTATTRPASPTRAAAAVVVPQKPRSAGKAHAADQLAPRASTTLAWPEGPISAPPARPCSIIARTAEVWRASWNAFMTQFKAANNANTITRLGQSLGVFIQELCKMPSAFSAWLEDVMKQAASCSLELAGRIVKELSEIDRSRQKLTNRGRDVLNRVKMCGSDRAHMLMQEIDNALPGDPAERRILTVRFMEANIHMANLESEPVNARRRAMGSRLQGLNGGAP